MNRHHGTYLSILLAILLIAAGCQNNTKGGGGGPDDSDSFSSGNTDFDQETDPSGAIDDLSDQVDDMADDPNLSSQEQQAYAAGGSALDKIAQAWQGVKPGASLNEVLQWFSTMQQYQNSIQNAANLAKQAQIQWLYLALMRFVRKTPVWRVYKGGHHLQTTDKNEINTLKQQGWIYEGLSFFVWKDGTPQEISLVAENAKVKYYDCRAGAMDHFISNAANCEGQTVRRYMGFGSNAKNGLAPLQAVRLYHPWGDHITTLEVPNDPNDEPSFAVTVGYRREGGQGYPPL